MSNTLKLTADVTAQAILTPVALNTTPLLGGAGREAILRIPVLPLTGVFSIEGAPTDPDTGTVPIEASTTWAEIVEIDASSEQIQEIELPDWIRINVTTADGDGPDVLCYLEGVQ